MPDYDPYSALTLDEPTAAEMARARAAALRGQNFAGLVGSLAHDPYAARSGAAMMDQAQQGLTQLGQLPGARLKQALGQQELQKSQFEAAGRQDPAYGAAGRMLLKKWGSPVPDETSNPAVQAILPVAEKSYEAEQNRLLRQQLAEQAGRVKLQVAGVGPGGGSLSPEAIDQWADTVHATGTPPPRSLGPANIRAVLNRAAERYPGADMAGNRASYTADTASQKKLQISADSMDSFENTALKNIKLFQQAAHEVIDTGSPFFNKPIRQFADKFAGDPRMARFNTLRQTAVQESGKVLGGAVAGGGISDSQRHEVESLLSGDMTLPQIDASIAALEQDMANRKQATHGQLAEIHARLSGKPAATTPAAAPGSQPVRKFTRQNGKLVEVK